MELLLTLGVSAADAHVTTDHALTGGAAWHEGGPTPSSADVDTTRVALPARATPPHSAPTAELPRRPAPDAFGDQETITTEALRRPDRKPES